MRKCPDKRVIEVGLVGLMIADGGVKRAWNPARRRALLASVSAESYSVF